MSRREYLFLHAPLFCLGVVFVTLGTVFTVFPQALEHSPVSFETRGPIHHIWHYAVLMGGLALTLGLWFRHIRTEIAGLWACGLVVILNLIALVAEDIATPDRPPLSGIDAAARIAILSAIAARLYVLLRLNPQIERELHGR